MPFHLLPTRAGGAAENMALDFLLLQRYPAAGAIRFRHYSWHRPAFTFGYSQKISWIREQLAALATTSPDETAVDFDLCRRPTGGGLVDHRDDWTFSLVIPRGHPAEEMPASQSYRLVHEALAGTLASQGVDAEVKLTADPGSPVPAELIAGVCFQRAETFDVVHARSRSKIAGAAQKRNKRGLLFQGSLWRPSVMARGGERAFDWEDFQGSFTAKLGSVLDVEPQPVPWPDFNEDEVSGLVDQYSSPAWQEHR